MTDYSRLTATEVVALTRSGKLTVVDYAKSLLARVAARDAEVQAWAFLDPKLVLESAAALDAVPASERGILHGVAIGVKDMIHTRDMPTQHFSTAYKDHFPEVDAGPVQTLRMHGALIFGKTHTTEFASCIRGPPTMNPYDKTRTPGGSSSGSAAGVADFQIPIGLGRGSTIRPASFNGVFAMKPTWSSISREGLKIYSVTNDTLGLYARSVDDLLLLAEAFRLQDDVPPPSAPLELTGAKFGFCKSTAWPKAEEGTVSAFEMGKKLLKAAGAEVEDVELPESFNDILELQSRILSGEGRSAFLGEYLENFKHLDPLNIAHVENKKGVTRAQLLEAYDKIGALRPVMDKIASQYTAIVTPSAPGEAPVMEEPLRFTGDPAFNSTWTVLWMPVVSCPGFKGPNGMPIGLSLVAPRYHDMDLLRTAKAVGPVFHKGGFEWRL